MGGGPSHSGRLSGQSEQWHLSGLSEQSEQSVLYFCYRRNMRYMRVRGGTLDTSCAFGVKALDTEECLHSVVRALDTIGGT